MIDNIALQIPFRRDLVQGSELHGSDLYHSPFQRDGVYWVEPSAVPFKKGAREVVYTDDGPQVYDINCPWESLASSHAGLAIKPFLQGNGTQAWPYVEIKGSPAKIAQGHNVFGSDDFNACLDNLLFVFCCHYPGCQEVLDFSSARLGDLDITYSVQVDKPIHRRAVIDHLRHASKGQTKNRGDNYETTVYFGSRRGIKRIKVYLKGPELAHEIKQRKRQRWPLPSDDVVTIADKLVRFEVTLKRDWLERRAFHCDLPAVMKWATPDQVRELYEAGMSDVFEMLRGDDMTIQDDESVMQVLDKVHGDTRGRVARLMGFYQGLKSVGYEALKRQYPDRTFRRYVTDLEACGFSRAFLQSLHEHQGATVVHFPNVVNLGNLSEPSPIGYEYPDLQVAGL